MKQYDEADLQRAVERQRWIDERQRRADRQGNLALIGFAIMGVLALMCLASIAGGAH